MISEFNRRITVNRYIFSQDVAGGNVSSLSDSWDLWAKVEPNNGGRSLDNQQLTFGEPFRITVRSEESRPIYNEDEIIYLNSKLIIQTITREKEGRVNFLLIDAYTTNEKVAIFDIIDSDLSRIIDSDNAKIIYQ